MNGARLGGELDVPTLWRMWAEGVREAEICERLKIRPGSFWQIRQRLKLPKRQCDRSIDFSQAEPPTPEEIAERAAAVRLKWSPEEEARRRCASDAGVQMRCYHFDHRNHAMTALDS
jgi:hypothetical protein